MFDDVVVMAFSCVGSVIAVLISTKQDQTVTRFHASERCDTTPRRTSLAVRQRVIDFGCVELHVGARNQTVGVGRSGRRWRVGSGARCGGNRRHRGQHSH